MPRSISLMVLYGALLALAAAGGGCQRKETWNLAAVEGTITKGGRPLAGIAVAFMPEIDAGTQGPRATAVTDEAGRYRLRTDNGDGGAVVGKHRVVIYEIQVSNRGRGGPARRPLAKEGEQMVPDNVQRPKDQLNRATLAPRVPPSYGRFNETPLRVEVHPGQQTLDFEIR